LRSTRSFQLAKGLQAGGEHHVESQPGLLLSGIYFAVLRAGAESVDRKLTLLK